MWYRLPYSAGRGLSLMPPSTTTKVRAPCLTVSTRYSVTPAGPTIARPGSTVRRGTGMPWAAHSCSTTRVIRSAKAAMSRPSSPGR